MCPVRNIGRFRDFLGCFFPRHRTHGDTHHKPDCAKARFCVHNPSPKNMGSVTDKVALQGEFFRSSFGFLLTLTIPPMSLTHLSTPTTIETCPNRGHINTTAVLVLDTTRSFIVNLAMQENFAASLKAVLSSMPLKDQHSLPPCCSALCCYAVDNCL